jgi:transcriptional regulator with XRE-family HTH domain
VNIDFPKAITFSVRLFSMGNDFAAWTKSEIEARGWTQAELAKRGGFSTAALSHILNRERLPGVEICRGIAKAFGMKDIQVLEIAGLATDSSSPKFSLGVEAIAAMLNDLPEEDQEEIRAIVRVKWERRRRKAIARSSKP